jgi:CBS domain containing-hemolysin-like protein
MRRARSQLALVTDDGTGSGDGTGATIGLVALEDLLERVLGEFEDETDHRGTKRHLA